MTCHESVGLLITYRCNLDCRYCYVSPKRNVDMTLEMAQKILEPFLKKDDDLLVTFMGGETLLAIDTICHLIEWVENEYKGKKIRFFGSTNGTLLSEEVKHWLLLHHDIVTLGLSYDGIPSAQIANRKNNNIDIDFFIQTWPQQPIQMTINTQTVSQMADGVIFLLKKGAIVHPNVAYENYEWDNKYILEYGKQLNKLIHFYTDHPNLPTIRQFEHNLLEYASNIDSPPAQKERCGAGHGFQVFDVDGKSYPCHILSPLVLRDEKLIAIKNDLVAKTTDFSDARCNTCPYITSCPTCIASNYLYRNKLQERDDTHCKIMQLEVKAFIKKEVLRLQKQEKLSPMDATTIDAIVKIRNYISNNISVNRTRCF